MQSFSQGSTEADADASDKSPIGDMGMAESASSLKAPLGVP